MRISNDAIFSDTNLALTAAMFIVQEQFKRLGADCKLLYANSPGVPSMRFGMSRISGALKQTLNTQLINHLGTKFQVHYSEHSVQIEYRPL